MPETVGHNVWSKEKKGSRDSGSTILKTKLRCTTVTSYTGLSLEQGVGGLPGLREDSLHMALFAEQLSPATPLADTRHE